MACCGVTDALMLHDLLQAFNSHDLDRIMAFFTDDCVLETPRGAEPWDTRFEGRRCGRAWGSGSKAFRFDACTFRHMAALGLGDGWRCWEVGAGGPSVPSWLAARVAPTGHVLATGIDVSWMIAADAPYDVRVHDVGVQPPPPRWAHRVADRFPDGKLYLNLRGFEPSGTPVPPADALRNFLDAFHVPPERIPRDPLARAALYRSLVAGRRVLVILDNARDSEQVQPLIPGAIGCLVVATSRDQLPGLTAAAARPLALDLFTEQESHDLLARLVASAPAGCGPSRPRSTRSSGGAPACRWRSPLAPAPRRIRVRARRRRSRCWWRPRSSRLVEYDPDVVATVDPDAPSFGWDVRHECLLARRVRAAAHPGRNR